MVEEEFDGEVDAVSGLAVSCDALGGEAIDFGVDDHGVGARGEKLVAVVEGSELVEHAEASDGGGEREAWDVEGAGGGELIDELFCWVGEVHDRAGGEERGVRFAEERTPSGEGFDFACGEEVGGGSASDVDDVRVEDARFDEFERGEAREFCCGGDGAVGAGAKERGELVGVLGDAGVF